jgi:hypothetical protein
MRELHSHLSPDEEVALRRVALGFSHGVASDHIRRLKDLHLIEADKTSWRLTALGRQRFKSLPRAAKLASDETPDAIAMMLAKFATQRVAGIATTRAASRRPDRVRRACFEQDAE